MFIYVCCCFYLAFDFLVNFEHVIMPWSKYRKFEANTVANFLRRTWYKSYRYTTILALNSYLLNVTLCPKCVLTKYGILANSSYTHKPHETWGRMP